MSDGVTSGLKVHLIPLPNTHMCLKLSGPVWGALSEEGAEAICKLLWDIARENAIAELKEGR